ncbi:histone deacetylase Hos3-like protein [Dothistroma septosporum NZE10]|uniref:Histone deacetylase Hos3-like protein n=1 Tax=Dothistroma septosporum (strain NZE10 / CBS 128990) TaxID=675120 RepID=N1PN87_DOTSN|nr:histone deacetylase Hos3-like protein [Dothistroma septosporum NZE10]
MDNTSGQTQGNVRQDASTTDLRNAMRRMSVVTAATSDTRSPHTSAPATPNLRTPLARRISQPPTSPLIGRESPRPQQHATLRRASSSASLNRPPPSPRLMRKSSRSSLGGASEEQEKRPTPKRSISNLISGLREAQSTMESIEEPIPLTAAQIATDHFMRELLSHSRTDSEAETIVILHDACYGHRYSRLKATKTTLSMIVERPERIHASVLGASTAYVRLGGHHAEGQRPPHPEHIGVSNPPFKIRRTGRSMDITSPFVTNVHGTAWMDELQGMCHSAAEMLAAGTKELTRSNVPGQPQKQQLHEGDLYLAPESINAFQGALGGVADAVDAVFAPDTITKRAFVAVRPPGHHCSASHPSGFCWLNNVHVGIEYAAQTHGLTHAAMLDFDLHHGDGSQAITWERNSKNNEMRVNAKPNSKLKMNPDLGYYSLHDINSYPCEMGDEEKVQAASLCIENAHGQSIWNVHLQPWKTEDDFWRLYETQYSVLLDKARHFLEYHAQRIRAEGKAQPRAAIFISAGFDASEWEGSGMQRHKVSVPTEFYARFTRDVVELAQSVDGCEGRVISVLEGGYSDRALCSGVLSHLSGLCAKPIGPDTDDNEALADLSSQMRGLGIGGCGNSRDAHYSKDWWSDANLTALEHKINPPPPPQAKKVRTGPRPTYATPTESFAYKVVDPQKFALNISGTMREGQMPVRPPTPPPPEVDWVVATQELSKLLIPFDRQTKSCTAEDLAVNRTKKERESGAPAMSTEVVTQPRQLRDRKAKVPAYAQSAHSDETVQSRVASRTESRSSRRETIDVLPSDNGGVGQRRVSRRMSAGSALNLSSSSSVHAEAPPVPQVPFTIPQNTGVMNLPPVPVPGALPNKKTRVPSKPRTTGTAALPPRPATSAKTTLASSAARSGVNTSSAFANISDLDNLTSGIRKITLKVSESKEEHDRKQREKLAAERSARAVKAAATRKVNAAAKRAATAMVPPSTAGAAPAHSHVISSGAPGQNGMGMTATVDGTHGVGVPPFAQVLTDVVPQYPPAPQPITTTAMGGQYPERVPSIGAPTDDQELPVFVPSASSGSISPTLRSEEPSFPGSFIASAAPPSSPRPQHHLILETGDSSSSALQSALSRTDNNVGSATPKRAALSPSKASNNALPIWSSTGPIPFGKAPGSLSEPTDLDIVNSEGTKHSSLIAQHNHAQNGTTDVKSVWDVPETPAK